MRDFFSLDGTFNKYGGYLADTLILSAMWIIFSIPLVTIGAATTAMFYVSTRRISEREGYIAGDFWQAFKANFVRSTVVWILLAVVAFIASINLLNIGLVTTMTPVFLVGQFIVLMQLSFITVYIFPMTARFEMGFKETFKTSFMLANRHLLTTITCVFLLGGLVLGAMWFAPVLIVAVPGTYAMLTSFMLMRVFKRYRPEMDKDPVLEIQEIEAQRAEERRKTGISSIDSLNETEENEINNERQDEANE